MSGRAVRTVLLVGVLCVASGVVEAGALVGYWPFDRNLDDVAGSADGTFVGGQASYGTGQVGQAVSFDGVDDYVDIPSPTNPAAYTIALWVKPARTDAAAVVTRTDASGPTTSWSHQLRINPSGAFQHYLWVGAERNVPGATAIVPDTWYHVTITAENNGPMRLYVNGQEDAASISTAGTLWATGDRIYVGSNSGHGMGWFQGAVDDLRIYDRELTAAQIKEMFEGNPPAFVKAETPNPADGTIGHGVPLLQWSKGEAALFHNVYLGTSPDLTDADMQATHIPMTLYYHIPGLEPGTTYYWRVDEVEPDMTTVHTGDVWSFVTQDVKAYYPTPADKANTASLAPTLTWMPGVGAADHHVYFGNSAEAVGQGATETDKGMVTEPTFTIEDLQPLTSYFWRVDETVAAGEIKAGPVWSFTTALPVDDFESYTDEEGERIYETWIDGWTNGTGSTVGNVQAPFAEQTIIHGGLQSMPLDYNNANAPFYSEADLEFSPTQDWTAGGIDTLILYVRGRTGNPSAPLCVVIEDSAGNAGTIVCPDATVVTETAWIEWKLPLGDFAGVNMARVKKLSVVAGDSADPKAGGAGRIYIDDICVVRPAL